MNITLYDGNNWFRRRIESDQTGVPVSTCFYEVQNDPSFPIVVWDGYNSREIRKKIYPEYKANRQKGGESIYESQDLLKSALKMGRGLTIEVPGYEADDVIGCLCRSLQADGHNIYIESNDGDFLQLGVPTSAKPSNILPRWVTLYKSVVGDSSDNIKGVVGFGKGTFEKLTEKELQLLETIVVSYSNESAERVMEHLEKLPLPKSVKTWMSDKDNRKQIFNYHKIVNFMPVSDQLIQAGTTTNSSTPELVEPIFKEYML